MLDLPEAIEVGDARHQYVGIRVREEVLERRVHSLTKHAEPRPAGKSRARKRQRPSARSRAATCAKTSDPPRPRPGRRTAGSATRYPTARPTMLPGLAGGRGGLLLDILSSALATVCVPLPLRPGLPGAAQNAFLWPA